MRPRTVTVPDVGFVIPATSFNAVLLPDPLRPITPIVLPGAADERDVVQRLKGLLRLQVAQDAALEQRALERREVPPAVATIDLGDVRQLDGGQAHTTSANESRSRSNSQ